MPDTTSATGYDPTTQYDVGPMKGGGTPMRNVHSQADARPKTIAFLQRAWGLKTDYRRMSFWFKNQTLALAVVSA